MNRFGIIAAAAVITASSSVSAQQMSNGERLISQLAGEFEGQMEVRRGEQLSVSVVSASNQFNSSGDLVCAFEGFAFGENFDCAMAFDSDKSMFAWTNDLDRSGTRSRFTVDPGKIRLVARSSSTEQVTTILGNDTFTVEVFDLRSGSRVLSQKMSFNRVSTQTCAADRFMDGSATDWSFGALGQGRASATK